MYHRAKLVPTELVSSSLRRPKRSIKKERERIVAIVLTAAYMPIPFNQHTQPTPTLQPFSPKIANAYRGRDIPEANNTTFVPSNPILLNAVGV
jgi:hypothetical protein